MANNKFSHVVLIGRPGVHGVPETLTETLEFLQQQNAKVTIEQTTATLVDADYPSCDARKLPNDADLILVIGGDGSLINAAHIAAQHDLPILGVHRGRLGFLTDIPPDELDKIAAVLQGQYQQEQRPFLQATFTDKQGQKRSQLALNDVILLPGDVAHMIEFKSYVNKKLLYSHRADGLIVATPTGSTAYALSGGGPILQPELEAMVLVPMFPHTLSSRPIVVPGSSHIRLHIQPQNETSPYISCDGISKTALQLDTDIFIEDSGKKLNLIHPNDYDYYKTLREKLGWERTARRIEI
jgi:NAD+ kinase